MSRSIALLLVLVFFTASCIGIFSPVRAEAQRKNVPSDYPTIASAIENANDGDTIFVKKGTYEENTLVIDKSISLVGEGAASTIINLHPRWIESKTPFDLPYFDSAIKIIANNVKVSGFAIFSSNASGSTIRLTGNGIQISGNYIPTNLFLESVGQNVTGNIIKGEVTCIGSNHTIAKNILNSIWNGADGDLIEGNIISDAYGIALGAGGNTVVNNTIKDSKVALTFWTGASSNIIYHNNFINNTKLLQIGELDNRTVGTWDRGYPYGGNYWSDYLLKCPDAKEINDSGIGDTPYAIDQYNRDNYPLMSPINISDSLLNLLPQLETTPPTISVMSPEGRIYSVSNLSLTFTLNELTAWVGYSLDNHDNITISGNTTLPNLSDRLHNLTVSATDIFGNTGISARVFFTVDTISPIVSGLSPQNQTYTATDIPLTFTVNEPTLQITYALDGEDNITIAGNTTLTGLANGDHNLIIYAKDEAGNVGASETMYFSVDAQEPFPTVLFIAASGASVAVVATSLLVYFKKRKHQSIPLPLFLTTSNYY